MVKATAHLFCLAVELYRKTTYSSEMIGKPAPAEIRI